MRDTRRIRLYILKAFVLMLFPSCGALKSPSSGSSGAAASSGARGVKLNGVGNGGTWAVEWKAPRSLSVIQHSFPSSEDSSTSTKYVFEYPGDGSLDSRVCFNNNMSPRCAGNSRGTKDIVDLDPTLIHGLQLNFDVNSEQYSAFEFSAQIQSHEIAFSSRTGMAQFVPGSRKLRSYAKPGSPACSPTDTTNTVSFFADENSDPVFITALYLHEEYENVTDDEDGKKYYKSPYITAARVVSRGLRVSPVASVGEFVPFEIFSGNVAQDIVTFGKNAANFKRPPDSNPEDVTDGIYATKTLGWDSSEYSGTDKGYPRVITGICIRGKKTYRVTGNTRPLIMKMSTRVYTPRLVDCAAESGVCGF